MNPAPQKVAVMGRFDDLRAPQLRFLQEAARFGELTVFLFEDEVADGAGGSTRFPYAERSYFLRAVRYVHQVIGLSTVTTPNALPVVPGYSPDLWCDMESAANASRDLYCRQHGLEYRVVCPKEISGFPNLPPGPSDPDRQKVIVTGCYDWFHSGHIRFFEEVSTYGDLYVVLGHDANIRALKGEGHPLVPQDERRYAVGSIRYVKQALISTGDGWLDADPEIQRLKPGIYAVNEDGDRGGKREYCAARGIQYLVLKRAPAPGLPKRTSTDLRGF